MALDIQPPNYEEKVHPVAGVLMILWPQEVNSAPAPNPSVRPTGVSLAAPGLFTHCAPTEVSVPGMTHSQLLPVL